MIRSKSSRSRKSPRMVTSPGSSWISTPSSRRMMSASTGPRHRSSAMVVNTSGCMPSLSGKPALASSSRAGSGLIALGALLGNGRVVHRAQCRIDRAEGRHAEDQVPGLDEPVAVERSGKRRPHLEPGLLEEILQRLVEIGHAHGIAPGVQVHGVEARTRRMSTHDVRVRLEALDQLGRHRGAADDLYVAGLERRASGSASTIGRMLMPRDWGRQERISSRTPPAAPPGRACARPRGTGRCRPASGRTAPRRAPRARGD